MRQSVHNPDSRLVRTAAAACAENAVQEKIVHMDDRCREDRRQQIGQMAFSRSAAPVNSDNPSTFLPNQLIDGSKNRPVIPAAFGVAPGKRGDMPFRSASL